MGICSNSPFDTIARKTESASSVAASLLSSRRYLTLPRLFRVHAATDCMDLTTAGVPLPEIALAPGNTAAASSDSERESS
jgi:hypothetical protein